MLLGHLGKRQGGHDQILQHIFRPPHGHPFLRRLLEGFLETPVEGTQTQIGPFRQFLDTPYLPVVGDDKVLEIGGSPHDGQEEPGQVLFGILSTRR